MPERIPKSIAKRVVFRAIASSDHYTPATGKTIAITISKNGGAFGNPAAGATNATEISSGFYYFDLGTGDTGTGGPLAWRGAGTGIDDIGDVYEVVNATNAGFTALPDAAAGASGGALINGSNSGTVTLAALTVTGALTVSDGVIIAAATSNRSGMTITGNGSGHALSLTPGATGNGLKAIGGATSGDAVVIQGTAGNSRGMLIQGQGSNDGLEITAGATGIAVDINGGATSGNGVDITAGADSVGINVTATAGTTGKGILVTSDSSALELQSGSNAIYAFGTTSGASINGESVGVQILGGQSGGAGDALALFAGWSTGAALKLSAADQSINVDASVSTLAQALLDEPVNSEWTWREALDRIDVELSSVSAGGGLTAADIWTYGTRTLTAIDEDSTTLDLDATIRAAVGLASADLDSQLAALPDACAAALLSSTVNSEWTVREALDRIDVELSSVSAGGGLTAADVWSYGTRTLTAIDEDSTTLDLDATIRSAIGLASANLDTQLADLPTNLELASSLDAADDAVLAAIAALSIPTAAQIFTAVLTTQVTESYRSNGASPTLAQAICELLAHHGEASNSGTTKTLKKFDHVTTAATFTYDSATNPTSVTRST